MRRLESTMVISSLLALACSADIEGGGGMPPTTPSGSSTEVASSAGASDATGSVVSDSDVAPVASTGGGAGGGMGGVSPSTSSTSDATTEPTTEEASACAPGIPVTSQLPRLTNAQYDRTVFDLLGVISPGLLSVEQAGPITKPTWDGYALSADAITNEVMGNPTLKANFMKCTPEGDGDACLRATITEFGRRAYRRPLTPEETAAYEDILAARAEITESNTPDQVGAVLLSTFLKSPSFIHRSELGQTTDANGNYILTPHEVASRLSYMLWGTMPDQLLSDAADNNELQTKEQVLAQAKRMVAHDKARIIANEFHDAYLHISTSERWGATIKDETLFPDFTPQVTGEMILETQMLFDEVFTSGGSFQDLLLTKNAYVTSRTAPLYGLSAADFGDMPTKTELDASRPGFLTRVGFLAAFSNQNRTNPIVRGAFVLKGVLGVDPGPPPAAAANAVFPADDPTLDTVREKVEVMTSAAGCKECHEPYVNPPGFALEAFDTTGKAQTMEKGTTTPINTVVQFKTSQQAPAVTINNPAELMAAIANAETAQRFYAEQWVAKAYERTLTGPDVCTVDALATKVAAGNYSLQDLLTDLTQQDLFMARKAEVTQ